MIPLLAATSAIGAVDQLASTAVAAWKSLSSSQSKPGAESFASLLSAHGVDVGGGASPVKADKPATDASSHHHVNRLA